MPSWKKVITSGSDASLASLFVTSAVTSSIFSGSRYIGASFTGSYTGSLTGTLIGTASFATSASWAPSTSQWTSSGANIYYNIGNVGIGTTSPGARLDVVGTGVIQTGIFGRGADVNFRLVTIQDDSTNVNGSVVGELGLDYSTTRNAAIRFHRGGSTTGGFISFTTFNGTERARFDGSGNLGIGTTTPSYRLDVSGSSAFSATGVFNLQRITPVGSSGRQIVITSGGVNAGNVSIANNIICIGPFAGQALTGSGADSIIAIGINSAGTVTTGGSLSIHIGRGAGNGITTGNNNVIICSSNQTNIPASTDSAIHLLTGGGYEGDNALRTLGGETTQYAFIGGGNTHPKYTRRFYFGGGPFVTVPQNANIDFYAPSATGSSDQQGPNFTINAGRGTGTGTPGDFIIATSTTGSSGTTNQTLSNRVWIKGNSGNVGIGSSTPGATLDVNGNVRATSFTGSFSGSVAAAGSNTQVIYNNAGVLAGSNNFIFDGSNVGIGTTTVASGARLHINGYATVPNNSGWCGLSTTGNIVQVIGLDTSNRTVIGTTSVANVMVLTGTSVGIGTTAPDRKLSVSGSIGAYVGNNEGAVSITVGEGTTGPTGNIISLETNSTSNTTRIYNTGTSTSLNIGSTGTTSDVSLSSVRDLYFKVNNAGDVFAGTTALYVSSSGNVGIGTTTPTLAKLQVNGNVHATSFTGSFSGSITSPGSNTQIIYNNAGVLGGSNNLVFNGSNVGIGSVSPAFPLDVNGTVRVTTLIETSTKILKENIQPYSTDINKFKKLKPVSFNWKDTKKEDIGLIAEDLNKVFPEFVSKDDGKPVGIHYGKLAAIFINVIKEQQERIEALEKQVKKLIK